MNSGDQGWKDVVNESLAKSARLSRYTTVIVLIIYWEGGEDGFRDEGLQLGRMFQDTFGYSVECFEIPLTNGYLRLHQVVTRLSLALSASAQDTKGSSLLIVHYGGHGDRNDRKHEGEEKQAVWSSNNMSSALLPWYKIQDDLENLDIDLLLLFDCCFAAQAGRAGSDSFGKSELLAAAAMGMMTPMPGERSFTVALIKEILKSYNEAGVVIMKDVHAQLVKRSARLHATPVHVNLRPGKRSIQLEPLPEDTSPDGNTTLHGPYIPLVLHTRDDIGRLNINSFVKWLGEDRPREVLSVKVLETTSHIHEFVQSIDEKRTPLAKTINDTSLDSIMEAWDNMLSLIDQYNSMQERSRNDISILRSRAQNVLERLDSMNHEFADTLERGVITVNSSRELQMLDDAIDDPISNVLGVVDALRLRQIVYSTNKGLTGLVDEHTAFSGASLTEEKKYEWYFSEEEKEQLRVRIRHLALLLSAPKDAGFQSLRCYRCEHKVFDGRYILHFEVPPVYDVTVKSPLSLTTLLERAKGSARPTLDDRLKIAYLLAKAVHKWHSTGWVHQGISSPNIRFFRFKNSGYIDFTQPFLMGFDFARPDSDPSLGHPTNDPYFDIYRHPARQGLARQGHRKIHDYYALGVVLLEIGLWQSAVKILTRTGESLNPTGVQNALKMENSERLSHHAGVLYQEAVDCCLNSSFDDDVDDKGETRLLNQFYEKVVRNIASGITVR